MKRIFTLALLATLVSCSKDSDNEPSKDRTLSATVQEYQPSGSGDYYWSVRLTFNPQVTIQGSVKVDFDVYYMGTFDKHHSQTVNFQLTEKNVFTHNTLIKTIPWGQGQEARNVKVENLVQNSGNYNITVK